MVQEVALIWVVEVNPINATPTFNIEGSIYGSLNNVGVAFIVIKTVVLFITVMLL